MAFMQLYSLFQCYVMCFHHSLPVTTNPSRFCFFGVKFFIFPLKQQRSLDNKLLDNTQIPFQANYQHHGKGTEGVLHNGQSQICDGTDSSLHLHGIFNTANSQTLQTTCHESEEQTRT